MKIDGIEFCNADQDMVVKSIMAGGWEEYSRVIWEKLVLTLPSGATVWDVGAYTGYYALKAAQLRDDINIYAFEPHPDIYKTLTCNTNKNSALNIDARNVGIGAVDSSIGLNVTNSIHLPSGSSFINIGKPIVKTLEVPVVSGDNFVATTGKSPALIKIDVEGFELDVLIGMVNTLAANKTMILMEILKEDQFLKVLNFMVALGYFCSRVNEKGADFSAPFQSNDRNYLFYVNPDILRGL